MPSCVIVDIDGTIANLDHRLHLIKREVPDWDAFFDACPADTPIAHMVAVVKAIDLGGIDVVYVSGRSDRCRYATETWLVDHGFPMGGLYMRKDGDYKPDHELKLELLAELRGDGYQPIMAFEDRKAVVEMWRTADIPCAQVAEGNF